MSQDCLLGRGKPCGERRQDTHALHGALRNVLELSGGLAEETFFLGAGLADAFGVSSMS